MKKSTNSPQTWKTIIKLSQDGLQSIGVRESRYFALVRTSRNLGDLSFLSWLLLVEKFTTASNRRHWSFLFLPNVAISTKKTRCYWLLLTLASEINFIHSELSIKKWSRDRRRKRECGHVVARSAKTWNGGKQINEKLAILTCIA